jgi:hypothetical protein
MEAKPTRIQPFHRFALFFRHGCQPAGNATAVGVLQNGIQGGLDIAAAHRKGVDGRPVKLREDRQKFLAKMDSLATPGQQIYHSVFAALFGYVFEILEKSLPVTGTKFLKFQHFSHILIFASSIPHFKKDSTTQRKAFC